MSSAREILKGFKEKRAADAAAETLRIPVPHPLVLLGALLLYLVLQCGPTLMVVLRFGRDRANDNFLVGWSLLIAVSTVWGLAASLRKRDRLWRELVRKEAPELYAKLQKLEANKRLDGTPVESLPSNPGQVSGVPHPEALAEK